MIFLVICTLCSCFFLLLLCFALDFSFFHIRLLHFGLFALFFLFSIVAVVVVVGWLVFFEISSCVCTQYKSSTQQKPHTIYLLDACFFFIRSFFWSFFHTLELVIFFQWLYYYYYFFFSLWLLCVCVSRVRMCNFLLLLPTLKFWFTIKKKNKQT